MRLSQLEGQFLKREVRHCKWQERTPDGGIRDVEGPGIFMPYVDSLAEAHGISFLCPACFAVNQGAVGTHSVICWFRGKVPDDASPGPGRWTPQGTGLEDLTFVPGDPPMACSVLLTGDGCGWHGFVTAGDAT